MTTMENRIKFFEIIKTFKEQIIALVNDDAIGLSESQRRDRLKRIEIIHEKLMLAKTVNSQLVIHVFYHSVVKPYARHILQQDESFFLNLDLNQTDLATVASDVSTKAYIDEIKKIWTLLDKTTKK